MLDDKREKKLSFQYENKGHILEYVRLKSEKIASALHVVTSLMAEGEPLRLELRTLSIALIADSARMMAHNESLYTARGSLIATISALISLVSVGRHAGLISHMNGFIIEREYVDLGELVRVRSEDVSLRSPEFTSEYFKVSADHSVFPDLFLNNAMDTLLSESRAPSSSAKEGIRLKKSSEGAKDVLKKNNKGHIKDILDSDKRHNARRVHIINLIRNKGNLSIKDVRNVIRNCSEKTLQRELAQMVDEGVLKKQGERRWTIYSLR